MSADDLRNEESNERNYLGTTDDEFPHRASLPDINRRDLLKFMGASMALAGVAGCRSAFMPQRELVPYVEQPENMTPGEYLYFRSAAIRSGFAFGIHVASREGRPLKIEGNPDHPASLGSCDPVTIAEMLQFYDPDRLKSVTYKGEPSDWETFLPKLHDRLESTGGEGVRLLMGATTSPTLKRQLDLLKKRYPGIRIHIWDPLHRDAVYEGARMAFGVPGAPIYRFDRAKVVLLVDFDFDRPELGAFRYARDLMESRRTRTMNRIYSVHTAPNLATGFADHSRALSPQQIRHFVHDLAAGSSNDPWTLGVLADLTAHHGEIVVAAGEYLPPDIHAAIHAINLRLGAPFDFLPPIEPYPEAKVESLRGLCSDLLDGRVETLVILGGNPAYDAPPEFRFAEALARAKLTAHYTLFADETSRLCLWNLPATHFLEHWTDGRAYDGVATIGQPLIEPLFEGRSVHEILGALLDDPRPPLDLVKETWIDRVGADWDRVVMRGVIPDTAATPLMTRLSPSFHPSAALEDDNAGFEICVRPDPYIRVGEYANNGWLQELGKPLTGITWSNAVLVSPDTARELKVEEGQWVEIQSDGVTVSGPVWIAPRHANRCATVHLGYGRDTGTVAAGLGFDANPLRSAASPFVASGSLRAQAKRTEFAVVQRETSFEGRDIIHEFRADEFIEKEKLEDGPTLYALTDKQETQLPGEQWGMSIDLSVCVGCNACVAACVSENNIPVVGPEQVIVGRQMHWIRVDRYSEADRLYFQPVPCMHCETAPCEPVCPVGATVHSHDGLNQMIYNRCVGTRYCSNNCPYKVRRFNFLEYDRKQPNYNGRGFQLLRLLNNPDVTVRSRGVMEKCTYCVQRISRARIEAKKENRPIRDGEILTACQQACPTGAIVFGNLADRASKARQLRDDQRTYALLGDLNTRPRTTYLAKLRNPNREMPLA